MSGALLLDAGVWLAARDRDDAFHAAAVHIVRGGAGDVAVLDLTLYEIASVATVRWRAPDEAERLVAIALTAAGPRIARADERLVADAATLASERHLTVYDAAYVACARARGWRLVSTDLADLVRPGLAVDPHAAAESSAGDPHGDAGT